MSVTLGDKERRVIPRWRKSDTASQTGELGTGTKEHRAADEQDLLVFHRKLSDWRHEHNVSTAADLVASAVVLGQEHAAQDAAEWILGSSNATDAVMRLARLVRNPTGTLVLPKTDQSLVARARIRWLRERLRNDPRNAIAWTNLAREYTILGLSKKAADAMTRAVLLVTGNRFVLRAGARLFTHLGQPDIAHDLLATREATLSDPWLLASEIAVASVAGRRSKLVRRAQRMLGAWDGRQFHVAELGSALGTLELADGALKNARKLLRDSLREPNENALAQATWISRFIPGVINVDTDAMSIPYSFEARSLNAYAAGNWSGALAQSQQWQQDEPFSSRPAVFGSFVAAFSIGDYKTSRDLALAALETNPGDPGLLNNLVVALASLGELEEAISRFRSIQTSSLTMYTRITLTATQGLLLFRGGQLEQGRAQYYEAIDAAMKKGQIRLRNLAAAHLALEEVLVGSEPELIRRAISAITPPIDADIIDFAERVRLTTRNPHLLLQG